MEKTNRTNQKKPINRPKKLNIITNKKRRNKMEPKYIENLSEPWFTLIQLGLKTVEGRKNKGKFKEMKVGDIIEYDVELDWLDMKLSEGLNVEEMMMEVSENELWEEFGIEDEDGEVVWNVKKKEVRFGDVYEVCFKYVE